MNGHVAVIEGIPQAIINHGIHNAAIGQSHPRAPAHIRQHKRAIAHTLLPAGNTNIRPSQKNHLKSKINRFDTGRTDFINGDGRHGFRHSCKNCGLASGNLATTGRNYLSHKDIVHIRRFYLAFGSAQNFLDRHSSQFHCRKIFERSTCLAIRCAACFHTNHFPEFFVRIFYFSPHGRKVRLSFTKLRDGRVFIDV